MPPKRTREGEDKVPAESADAVVDTAAADATALVHLRGTDAGASPPPVECRLHRARLGLSPSDETPQLRADESNRADSALS